MSRLPPADPATLDDELSAIVDAGTALLGFTPNDGLVMAHQPALLRGVAALVGAVWGPGLLDAGLKRLLGEMSSKTAGCMYCTAHAAHSAHRAGVPQEKLDALWDFEASKVFTEAERAALRFTMLASQTPAATTDADFAALREHYSVPECVEIMSVVAVFGFLNRWNDNLATGLEDAPRAFAEARLAPLGWSGDKHRDAD